MPDTCKMVVERNQDGSSRLVSSGSVQNKPDLLVGEVTRCSGVMSLGGSGLG